MSRKLLKAHFVQDRPSQVQYIQELSLYLIFGTKDVGVVLSEATYPRQTVQFSSLLVAVHRAKLRNTHRQVAVRVGAVRVNFAVVRAVHWFEQKLLPFPWGMDGLETILAILGIVPGSDVQFLAANMGGSDQFVAPLFLFHAQEIHQTVAQGVALG